jgi:hypothetical protein
LQAADWLVWQLRFRFASAGAKSDLPIDEDKPFITHKAEDASQARLPVIVNIWDGHIMEVVRDNVLNERLTKLNEMDMPPELREYVRRILIQKR